MKRVPWQAPCPVCFRPQCGWHKPNGKCDGEPRPVPQVVEEMREVPDPGRPVWQMLGLAYVVAFVLAVLVVWLLVGA